MITIYHNVLGGKIMVNYTTEQLQKIELNILKWIDKVCKENNIKYFLGAGTLLGAVRHQGFIPWDDDIDLFMLREDYEKFMNLDCSNSNFKILSLSNSKDYYYPYIKVIDKRLHVSHENLKPISEYGLWIDIFPLDNANINFLNKIRLSIIKKKYVLSICSNFVVNENRSRLFSFIKKTLFKIYSKKHPRKYSLKIEQLSKTGNNNANEVLIGLSPVMNKDTFKKEWLAKAVDLKFEDGYYPCPDEYDKFLTHRYGNYMQLPPENQRFSSHDIVIDDEAKFKEILEECDQ